MACLVANLRSKLTTNHHLGAKRRRTGTWPRKLATVQKLVPEEDYEEEGPNCIHKLNILTQ